MKKDDDMKEMHLKKITQTSHCITEIEESETGRKLAEVEELYKIMAESSLGAVFIVQDGKIRFINTSAIAYAGYTAEEAIGHDSDMLVHPEDKEKVKKLAREMLEGKRKSAFDFRLVTKQNKIRWILQTVTPIQYDGRPAILGNAIDITDLKQAEELYKIIAESSLGAVFIVQDGKYRFINTSAIAFAGYTSEELIGHDPYIMVHPEDREKVKAMTKEVLTGKRKSFDFRLVTKNKQIRWISQTVTPIEYDGRPAILGNAIDITDLKQAEELYKIMAESSLGAVFIVQNGKYRFINTSAISFAGYTSEELIGHDPYIMVHPEDREKVKALTKEVLTGKRKSFDFRLVTKNKQIRWISQTVTPLQYEGKPAILGNAIDITDLKQAEALYETLAESSIAAVFIVKDGKFSFINTSAIAYAGYTAEELIGRDADIIVHPEDKEKVKKLSKEMLAGTRKSAFDFRMVTKQNKIRWISQTVTPIQYEDGPAILGNALDVTELKQAEELYETLAESSVAAVFIAQDGKFRFINTSAIAYAGYTAEELIGQDANIIIHPEDREKVKKMSKEMLSGSRNAAFDFRMVTKQNKIRWISETVTSIQYHGKPAILGNALDVTELKQAEEALRESERLHSVILGSPIPAFVIGKDHHIIHWNKALEELSGIKSEEVIGTAQHWKAFYNTKRPCLADLLVDGLTDEIARFYPGKNIQSKLIEGAYEATDFFPELGKTGRWLHFTAAAIRSSKGDMTGAIETLEDITEEKRMAEALRESEERLRSILEGSPTPTFVVDKNHHVIVWNKALAELTGISSNKIIATGDHPKIINHEKHPTVADMLIDGSPNIIENIKKWYGRDYRRSKLLDEAYEATGPFTFPGRDPYWLHFTSASIRNGKGEMIGAMETMTDISPLKHAEDKLKENVAKLKKVMTGVIWAIDVIVETRDPYTAGHQHQVAQLATAIATDMGLPPETIEAIYVSSSIHDLGKIYVPAEILSKPGHISEIERGIIRTHPQVGYDILKTIDFPWPIAEIVLQHHERIDGSGYPRGLKEGNILIEARILGLADVVESMGSHRPYRPTLGIDKALDEIRKNRGILYDPDVVDSCLSLFLDKGFHFEQVQNDDGKWYSGEMKQ